MRGRFSLLPMRSLAPYGESRSGRGWRLSSRHRNVHGVLPRREPPDRMGNRPVPSDRVDPLRRDVSMDCPMGMTTQPQTVRATKKTPKRTSRTDVLAAKNVLTLVDRTFGDDLHVKCVFRGIRSVIPEGSDRFSGDPIRNRTVGGRLSMTCALRPDAAVRAPRSRRQPRCAPRRPRVGTGPTLPATASPERARGASSRQIQAPRVEGPAVDPVLPRPRPDLSALRLCPSQTRPRLALAPQPCRCRPPSPEEPGCSVSRFSPPS